MRVEDYTTNKGAEANHSVNGWVEENYDFTKKLKNNICDTSKKAEEKAVSIYGANGNCIINIIKNSPSQSVIYKITQPPSTIY
jgi:hypothetical protein